MDNQPRQLDNDDKLLIVTAIHEAAHAVIARCFGIPVHEVELHNEGGSTWMQPGLTISTAAAIAIEYAGIVAEGIIRVSADGAKPLTEQPDYINARDYAIAAGFDVERAIGDISAATKVLLRANWQAVVDLGDSIIRSAPDWSVTPDVDWHYAERFDPTGRVPYLWNYRQDTEA